MKSFFGTISACLALLALTPIVRADSRSDLLKKVGIDQHIGAQVPGNAAFQDENGNPVTLDRYFHNDRPLILCLVYFKCPMLCTTVLNELNVSLDTMPQGFDVGKKFDVLTISFNPKDDFRLAAKKKENYLRHYGRAGAENGWHFLTGDQDSIDKVTQAVGFRYVRDPHPYVGGSYGTSFTQASPIENLAPDEPQFIHAGGIMVLTPTGKVSKYFYGINYAPRDLRLALTEAGQGKSGTLTDAVLLFCFHYDPSTGKYTLAVLNLIKVVAALLLVVIAFFWTRAIWRERRRARLAAGAFPTVPPGVG
jgi:protein SCO1/2